MWKDGQEVLGGMRLGVLKACYLVQLVSISVCCLGKCSILLLVGGGPDMLLLVCAHHVRAPPTCHILPSESITHPRPKHEQSGDLYIMVL